MLRQLWPRSSFPVADHSPQNFACRIQQSVSHSLYSRWRPRDLATLGFGTIGAISETVSPEIPVHQELAMRSFRRCALCFLIMLSVVAPGIAQEAEEHMHPSPGSEEGLGRAHME